MWNHYRTRMGSPSSYVFVRVYSADYVAMKRDTNGSLKPFLTRNMSSRRLSSDDPLCVRHADLFRHGCYVVFETDGQTDEREIRRKKLLFVVTPEEHENATHGTFFTADHLSFVVNNDARSEKRLQLHYTSYIPPNARVQGGAHVQGFTARVHNPLPLNFELHADRSPITHPNMLHMSSAIHDILARPWTNIGSAMGTSLRSSGGGRR